MFARSIISARGAIKAMPRGRSMGSVAEFKPPTMGDLPVPQGSWQQAYSAKQRANNLHLLVGVLSAGGTLAYLVFSDLMNFGFGPKIGK